MDSMKIMVVIIFSLGFIGGVSVLPIAAFPSATLKSRSRSIRFLSKSAIFSLCFFGSFVLTAIPLAWIMRVFSIQTPTADLMPWIYLFACLSIAAVLYATYMAIASAIYRKRQSGILPSGGSKEVTKDGYPDESFPWR
jgi:hypothetical protein